MSHITAHERIIGSTLKCPCGHVWDVKARAKYGRDAIGFVKVGGEIKACPLCGNTSKLRIQKYTGDDVDTPWMDWMIKHIGEAEKTGAPPTDFDRMVFSHTTYRDLGNRMESGCAATMCAALELSGFKSPHSAWALDFEAYGMPSVLRPGAICVFKFSETDHHVSFYEGKSNAGFAYGSFLGGNQEHYLKRSAYPLTAIIAIRWPVR